MNHLFKIILSSFILAVLLVGCDSVALWHDTNDAYAKNSSTIKNKNEGVKVPPPPVTTKREPYIDTHPVSLTHEPGWYNAPVTVNAAGLPFDFYVTQLLGNVPVQVHMDQGVNTARAVNLRYSGTVKGAMEELAAKSGYYYDYDLEKNTITWSALQTKTFDISFIPGASKYSVGNSGSSGSSIAGGSSGSSSSGSSSSSGGSSVTQTGIDVTATGEYSSLAGDNLSVWDDMKNTITNLLSPKGKLSVSQATTTITVRDRPSNIRDIGRYLDQMNKILSKQVYFDVQILEINLDKQFQYGINWETVQYHINSAGSDVKFSADFAGSASGILTNKGAAASGEYVAGSTGKWHNTDIFIKALEQQGKVSIINQPSLTTLNDQMAQISIQTQQSYLASQSTTLTGGAGDFSQQTLTPGVVTSGLQLYLLPKIQDDKIYLQISSTLSHLDALNTVTSTGGTEAASGDNAPSAIQVPVLSQKNFNQRSVLRNGQTLVLAGFKGLTDQNQEDSVAGLTALGGMAAQSTNKELVVLITPIILNGDNF
ncbi:MAG: bfpB [Gammaproteobacteria bacterium]|jgi:type IVB pilus formation R64 PilN family outer membrane protein|nr:bfpB [Gammaproteobacteria bacterium]